MWLIEVVFSEGRDNIDSCSSNTHAHNNVGEFKRRLVKLELFLGQRLSVDCFDIWNKKDQIAFSFFLGIFTPRGLLVWFYRVVYRSLSPWLVVTNVFLMLLKHAKGLCMVHTITYIINLDIIIINLMIEAILI